MPVIAYALIGIAALLLLVVSGHDLRKRYNRWSHRHAQNEVARRGLDDLRLFGKRFLELADPQRPNTVAYALKAGISILSLLSRKNLCLLPCRVKGKSLRLL